MPIEISPARRNLLRLAYLLLAAGLGTTIWPEILAPGMPAPMRGVVISMLGAIGLLALLGLRQPVRMLPLLMLEIAWKAIWLARIALPLWRTHGFDAASAALAQAVAMVVLFLPLVPWDHLVGAYLRAPAEPWRRSPLPAGVNRRRRDQRAKT